MGGRPTAYGQIGQRPASDSCPAACNSVDRQNQLDSVTLDYRLAEISATSWRLMHYSGILVIVNPGDVARAIRQLDALPGLEVHHHQVESGRLVVVQETETVSEQEEGLRRIQALPTVQMAALVEHRIDSEPANQPATGSSGEQG